MSLHEFVGYLMGYVAVFVIYAVVAMVHKRMWIQRAHKLAARSDIALGWGDLLRFRQVRAITISAAWAPGVVSDQVQWLPVVMLIAACLLLIRVFRQGRHLWRLAWLERG